jgi:hypothetical protein
MAQTPPRSWYVARWPALAWAETLLKLAALVLGIAAGWQAVADLDFHLPEGWRLIELIILVVLSMGLLAAIVDRWAEREVVAMFFVVINNLGHWGMVISLAGSSPAKSTLLLFAGLMLLGDVVKLLFIRVHRFTVRARSSSLLIGLTSIYILGYLFLILIEQFR